MARWIVVLFLVIIQFQSPLFGQVVKATGVVVANRSVTLAATIMGRVNAVKYSEGERVKAGEPVVTLENAELRAERAAARAAQALAQAEVAHRKRVSARMKRLQQNKSVSQDKFDEAQFALEAASAKLDGAKARVAKAEALLRETQLLAPFDGVVTAKHAEVGHVTQPGEPLLVLEDHSVFKFRTKIKERDIAGVTLGEVVNVSIDALDGLRLQGKVSKIVPSGDAAHSFEVEATLKQKQQLFPGMFGRVELTH